jgi:hypothetical protein
MWTGLAVCVLLLIVDVASVWWGVSWASRWPSRVVSVGGGKIQVLWILGGAHLSHGSTWAVGRLPTPGIGWYPAIRKNPAAGFLTWVAIPLWIPLVVVAIPTGFLWRRERRRAPPGHCRSCRYNLTGNVSGVCPECGETAAPSTANRGACVVLLAYVSVFPILIIANVLTQQWHAWGAWRL